MDLTALQKQKVVESLEVNKATQQSVNESLRKHNQDVRNQWDTQSYEQHRKYFEKDYYPLWMDQDEYKQKLAAIENIKVEGALEGKFENQLQPGERSHWKSRKNERKKIAEYKKNHPEARNVLFDKNTVRELSALKKYKKYHDDYFGSRNHQNALYRDYVEKNGGAGEQELNEGLRAFFSMTKKGWFFKHQVGQLGTETREEKKDGSEYNKRLLRVYTTGSKDDRRALMDELAEKLIHFQLNPNMLTNQYLAKNMLQMQRYVDMLNGFVALTNANPEYLNVKNENVAHTSPEMAALVKSRILRMAPVMTDFLNNHAKYFGYKKESGVLGKNEIDEAPSQFENEEKYNDYVAKTWERIKNAHNSTTDFMDDFCDLKIETGLQEISAEAEKRRERQREQNERTEEDKEFDIKYDVTGEKETRIKNLKAKIAANPYIYEIFGTDLNQIYKKFGEMIRRLDEVEARLSEVNKLSGEDVADNFKNVAGFNDMWKTYLNKETARIAGEADILTKQLENYEKAVDYLTGQKLDAENLKLTEPSEEVRNVFNYEGLNHIFDIKKAFDYNDIFYKTLDFYNFDKYTDFTDKNGQKIEIKDLWTQYNFTLLKRGVDRARMVNRLADGKTSANINDVTKLNNIEKRTLCERKFDRAQKEIEQLSAALEKEKQRRQEAAANGHPIEGNIMDTEVTVYYRKPKEGEPPKEGQYKVCKLSDLSKYQYRAKDVATADIEELTAQYDITKELDITSDESYEKYFRMKSVADMADKLDRDPNGVSIEGFKQLSAAQKDEVRIRANLFRDYFKRWEGQMEYTRSEAYAYLGDAANMQGNNSVIEGIDKQYRKNILTDMQHKLFDRFDKEKDADTKEKISQLTNYLEGMILENNYQAKAIKIFGKDAYEAYRASFLLEKRKKELKKTYTEDFEDLVKKGIIKDTKEEREKIEQKIDTALALQTGIERYFSVKKKEEKKNPQEKPLEKKEKKDLLRGNYQNFLTTVKKFDEKYANEEFIIKNIHTVLSEIDEAIDFLSSLNANNGENYELLASAAGIGEEEAEDLTRFKEITLALNGFVTGILRDYGIERLDKNVRFTDRNSCKRQLVSRDTKYAKEYAEAARRTRQVVAEEKKKAAKDKQLEKEIAEVEKLYREEEARLEKENAADSAESQKISQTGTKEKQLTIRKKNQYEDQYKELLGRRRISSFEEDSKQLEHLYYGLVGVYNEKIELEETKDKKRTDYIEDYKERNRKKLVELSQVPPFKKSRNYVDELFKYIQKTLGDQDYLDEEQLTKVLEKAGSTYFWNLSAGARREARNRLRRYKQNKSAMNDFSVWMNTQQTNEMMKENARVFGQDKFVEKNIDTIRTIVDAIAEAQASVNDMQTPEFLDNLKDTLEIKGIDERQFMFLMRRHNVGISGLSNTVKDANKAKQNKADIDKYLNVSTQDDFLIKTANEVLKAGEHLDLKNISEDYILSHFEECYFQANKLMAFQQLYYSEYDSFESLSYYDEYRDLVRSIKRRFDKGHGESYALYYNTVMSVAKKYGVSVNGELSFGLSTEEVQELYREGKADKETTDRIARHIKEAEKESEQAFQSIKDAYKQNDMSLKMQDAMDGSLAGVEVQSGKRTRYGLKEISKDKDRSAELKDFYAEHTNAYNGAQWFWQRFKGYEQNKNNVSYTKTENFYPQFLFFLAEDKAFDKAGDKIANKDIVTSFRDFFVQDVKSVGKNLSVIDTEKCKRAMQLIQDLGIDSGKFEIDKKSKTFSLDERWLDLNFDKELFEDMINAQNLCMMFEMNDDFMQLDAYEQKVEERQEKGQDEYANLYLTQSAKLKELKSKAREYEEMTRRLLDRVNEAEEEVERLERRKQTPERDARIKSLQEEIKMLNSQADAFVFGKDTKQTEAEIKRLEPLVKEFYAKSGMEEYGLVSKEKLQVLKGVRQVFSDKKTRFLMSTYFNFFNAYLLKNGIKLDASYTNSEVYDAILAERSETNFSSQAEALETGEQTTKEQNRKYEALYQQRLQNILSGDYEKEYQALSDREKHISDRKAEEKKALEKKQKEEAKALEKQEKEEKLKREKEEAAQKKAAEGRKKIFDGILKKAGKSPVNLENMNEESFAKLKLTKEQKSLLLAFDQYVEEIDVKDRSTFATLFTFATIEKMKQDAEDAMKQG